MAEQVKVIELTGVKLNPKAKYVICLHPQWGDWYDEVAQSLELLLGHEQFQLFPFPSEALKFYEVMPAEGEATDG